MEMDESLENLSPEQIAELQRQNCIFCSIASGKIPSKKVYEDEICMAFLDINPASPGHVLLVPKKHYQILPQIPDAEVAHMFTIAKYISNAALRTANAKGTTIFVANGALAGQRAPHVIIHIIPRDQNDGITSLNLPEKKVSEEELEAVGEKLASLIGKPKKIEKNEEKSEIGTEKTEAKLGKTDKKPEEKKTQAKKEPEVDFDLLARFVTRK